MLLMTKQYADTWNSKAKRTHDWLVKHMNIKPFQSPIVKSIK